MKNSILFFFFFISLFIVQNICATQINKKEHKSYPWFKQSFLDLQDDLSEAKEQNKGLILYFHQEGCPYCKKLLNDNFTRPELVKKLRNQYDFIAINMWGDRTVIDFDGKDLTEKSLAVKLKVMFTPTMIFFNSNQDPGGQVEFRLNGYYSPDKFNTLLDYLALDKSSASGKKVLSFTQFYKNKVKQAKQGPLLAASYINKTNNFFSLSNTTTKPIVILFEESNCHECNELHNLFNANSSISKIIKQFTLSQVAIHSDQNIIDIKGKQSSYAKWTDELKIQYTPTLVFFIKDEKLNQMKEIFRVDSYVKAFHLESVLLYIANKEYIKFPEFQRYIHDRVDKLEQQGVKIELWK
ncbi:MAG: thioredoxin fold domain-containing protein [Pseudomonadota bacterium]